MSDSKAIIDFDNPSNKRMFIGWIKTLRGLHEVAIKKLRPTRTLPQNALLWGVFYPALRDGLLENWGERLSIEEVHVWAKDYFLSQPLVNRNTGEVVGRKPGSTRKLDVQEFTDYLDKLRKFCAEKLNVEIPDSTMLEPDQPKNKRAPQKISS